MVRSLANSGPLDDEFFEKIQPRMMSYTRIRHKYMSNGDEDMVKVDPPTFGWLAIKWFLAVCAAFAVMVIIAIGLS